MQQDLKWFATRAIRDRAYVRRYLQAEGIQTACIADLKTFIFIHCPLTDAIRLKGELWGRVLFYREPDSPTPDAIPDREMKSFLIMAPYHNQPVIYLPVDDPSFFQGGRKRVTKGPFAGCEGVIRRIKGERRLIVCLSHNAAIATPYIPKEYLEDIE